MCRLAVTFILFFYWCCGFSQADSVYLINKKKMVISVTEIADTYIRYKELKYPDGPAYTISKKDIYKIVKSTGEIIEVSIPLKEKIERIDKKKIIYGHHYIGLNTIPLVRESFGLSYEYIFNRKTGIKLLGSLSPTEDYFSFGAGDDVTFTPKKNSGGIELNFYPNGQSVVTAFGGIGLYTAVFNSNLIYRGATQSEEALYFRTKSTLNSATLNVGVLWHLGKYCFIQSYGSLGVMKENFSKQFLLRYNFSIVAGISF